MPEILRTFWERLQGTDYHAIYYRIEQSPELWSRVGWLCALTAVIGLLTLYGGFWLCLDTGRMKIRQANRVCWSFFMIGWLTVALPLALLPYTPLLRDQMVLYYLAVLAVVLMLHKGLNVLSDRN